MNFKIKEAKTSVGLELSKYVNVTVNKSNYKNLISVENRANNKKRDYLFVNKLQGKEIPVKPSDCLGFFGLLSDQVNDKLKDRKVLVIGFAETATAIGSYIADNLDSCVYYLQTTREAGIKYPVLAEFLEEHSHAAEQILLGKVEEIPDFDYILFVDDEITTGKTVLNVIAVIKSVFKKKVQYGVASFCNWQNPECVNEFKKSGIDTYFVLSGRIKDVCAKIGLPVKELSDDFCEMSLSDNEFVSICRTVNWERGTGKPLSYSERTGRLPRLVSYKNNIKRIAKEAGTFIEEGDRVLILGTEEFMYIPLLIANAIERIRDTKNSIWFMATTRTPLNVLSMATDKVHDEICSRHKVKSFYGDDRNTFVYNLSAYDKVLVISDGTAEEGMNSLLAALIDSGNKMNNIRFIKVV